MRWLPLFLILLRLVDLGKGVDLSLTAASALLADAETGQILWGKATEVVRYPASLTKIMTAVLVLERGDLNKWVTVPREAVGVGGASMGLREGERVQLRDLLKGMLVYSANDASVAIAFYLAGSLDRFVTLMNEKARDLGMKRTHFVNPHGLHDPDHVTTAYDLLTLTRYALTFPTFRYLVAQKQVTIAPTNKNPLRIYRNRNELLWRYPGCDGIKTGYTLKAGQCLIASATREGWRLITIVLKSKDRFADAVALLDFGFQNFVPVTLAERGTIFALFRVKGGVPSILQGAVREKVRLVVPKLALKHLEVRVRQEATDPPIRKGQVIGEVTLGIPKGPFLRVPLVATHDVRWHWSAQFDRWGEKLLGGMLLLMLLYRAWRGRKRANLPAKALWR